LVVQTEIEDMAYGDTFPQVLDNDLKRSFLHGLTITIANNAKR